MKVLFSILCFLNICCIHGAKNDTIVTNSFLIYPNYRGSILIDDVEPWKILFQFSLNYKGKNLDLYQELKTENGEILESKVDKIIVDENSQFLLKQIFMNRKGSGLYLWNINLEDPDGGKYNYSIKINLLKEYPNVYVGKDGFLRINNERFFPFGIYTGTTDFWASDKGTGKSSFEDLKIMKDAGYNTVLSYFFGLNDNQRGKLFLKNAQDNNLKVIYSVKDFVKNYEKSQNLVKDIISELKDESSLLAWYTNDEMQIYEALDSVYNDVLELDKNHPVFQVTNMLDLLDHFYSSTDIIATDPYPIGDKFKSRNSLDNVTVATMKTTESAREAKGNWEILQLHNLDFMNRRATNNLQPPTLTQMRNMSYQALVNGAKGLLYFAYHWLHFDRNDKGQVILSEDAFQKRWQDVLILNREIKPLTGIILKDNKVDLKLRGGNVNSFQAWEDGNIIYLAVVNNDDKHQLLLNFDLPREWMVKENKVPNASINLKNGKLSIDLDPVACGLILLEKNK